MKKEAMKMEKKVISIVLVLGLVSVAGAGVSFHLDPASPGYVDPTTVLENTTATINLIADFDCSTLTADAITVSGGGVSAVGALHGNLMYHFMGSKNGQLKDGSMSNIVIYKILGGLGFTPPGNVPVPTGASLYNFDIQVGGAPSVITVDDLSGASNDPYLTGYPLTTSAGGYATGTMNVITPVTDFGGLQLNVVPEPMTVVLLGLGGLFLRRRK
jgi:hypothetical protein